MVLPLYTSNDDRYRRLEGCFSLIDNEPYVMRFSNTLKPDEVYIQPISPKASKKTLIRKSEYDKVQYTRSDIRIKDLPLGYVNVDGSAIYVTRHPTRSTSVGPSRSNLFYESNERGGNGFYAFCSGYGDTYLTQAFLGDYNPKDAIESVAANDRRSAALSHELAVKKMGPKMFSLLYKDTTLGYTRDLSEPFDCILPKGFINLISDKLQKVGVNVKH